MKSKGRELRYTRYVIYVVVPYLASCNFRTIQFDDKLQADKIVVHAGLQRPPTYEDISVITLHASDTNEARTILCATWGPPANQQGVIGLFGVKDNVIFSKTISGLMGIERVVSVHRENDSVVLRLLSAYGTGYRVETYDIITLANDRLQDVFQCEGSAHSKHGNVYTQDVQLLFVDTNDDGVREVIKMLDQQSYASLSDMETEKPNCSMKKAEIYHLDVARNVFVKEWD